VAGVQNCLPGRTFQSKECFTTSQSSTKKFYSSSQTSESNLKQVSHEHKPKLKCRFDLYNYFKHDGWHATTTSQSSNTGARYTNTVKRDVHLLLNMNT